MPAFSKRRPTAEAWNALANAHLLLDRLPEAEAAYRRALELSPGYRVAQRDYARLLVRRGKLNEAEQVARRLVEGDSGSAEGWDLLGAVFYAEGRIDEAVAAHRRCMELEPSRRPA